MKKKPLIIENPHALMIVVGTSDDVVTIVDKGKKDGERDDKGLQRVEPGDRLIIMKKKNAPRKKNKT